MSEEYNFFDTSPQTPHPPNSSLINSLVHPFRLYVKLSTGNNLSNRYLNSLVHPFRLYVKLSTGNNLNNRY
jgi:hypothetical protein